MALMSHAFGDPSADFVVRIFNVDGSEANLSGNGTRCAARIPSLPRLWSHAELRLQTRSGSSVPVCATVGVGKYVFESELGQPKLASASIPMLPTSHLRAS